MDVGRVISVFKERYILEINNLNLQAEVSGRYRFIHYLKSEYPQVGDYVKFRRVDESLGIIEQVCERSSVIDRIDVGNIQEKQILAANIDLVIICLSLNKDFNLKKLENYLTLTEGKNFKTIVLLTKSDLCDDIDMFLKEVEKVTEKEVLTVSIYKQDSILELRSLMQGRTSVFIGSSGVGKSSLVNSLIEKDYLETNDIRMSDAQGRHTTVSRELIKIDDNTAVIDTPGIRIVNAYNISESNFEDILNLSEGCKFRNCTHKDELGCMVKKAIEDNLIDESRLEAYNKALKINLYNQKREIERHHLIEKRMKKNKNLKRY